MRILLFCIDVLPYCDRIQTSGGSLRSQQFVEQFEAHGFTVIKAVPTQSLLVKTQRHLLADADFLFFDVANQAEIVADVRPDIIIWGWPLVAQIPIKPSPGTISIVDLNGFQNIECATASGAGHKDVTRALLQRAREADIVVYGSSEQRAYWEGLYRLDYGYESLPAGYVLPYFVAATSVRPYSAAAVDFFYVGSFLPWLSPFEALFTLAAELENTPSRLRVFASTQPTSLNDTTQSDLMKLSEHPSVTIERPLPYKDLYQTIGFSGVAFDLLEESFERRFAYPIRTISYLTHGIPLIYNDFSCLSDEVARSGAGWASSQDKQALRATIRGILTEPPERLAARSQAATKLSERLFACEETWGQLFAHLTARTRNPDPAPGRTSRKGKPNVLVFSDDELNILKLRCVAPLESLLRRDEIGGFAVVGKEGVRFSSVGVSSDAELHSVIVQRVPQVPSVSIMELTGGRFIYDIDDNLLTAPAYRPPFPPDFSWKVRSFLTNASTVTVTNAFLARSLACASGIDIAGKARIVPNPLLRRNFGIVDVPIRRVLFASSDQLPLIDSAHDVFPAIGAFCRRRGLEFCYVGGYPDNRVFRDYLQGVEIRSLHHRPYHEYLDMLEGLDALAVVPLETRGDTTTVDFVKSKSDIKVVGYLGMGRPAVFSDAAPYRYSDLPVRHLVPNDRECWSAALDAAYAQSKSERATAAAEVERKRWIGGSVSKVWLDNIQQNVLSQPIRLQRVVDTITSNLSKLRFSAWPAEGFDAMYYIEENTDVRLGLEDGSLDTAYSHYLRYGQKEGRKASPYDSGRSMIDHIEESSAAILAIDADMNRTDARIKQLKLKFGANP